MALVIYTVCWCFVERITKQYVSSSCFKKRGLLVILCEKLMPKKYVFAGVQWLIKKVLRLIVGVQKLIKKVFCPIVGVQYAIGKVFCPIVGVQNQLIKMINDRNYAKSRKVSFLRLLHNNYKVKRCSAKGQSIIFALLLDILTTNNRLYL